MNPVASYSFLPWLRQGVANTITSADHDTGMPSRVSVHVGLSVAGEAVGGGAPLTASVGQDIALYGPGDVIGIDPRAVIRTEPRNWVTTFESNYLAAVDFYDEDFPWRYTPAAPDGSGLRLRPWITLLVLREDEFEEGRATAGRPLAYLTAKDPAVLPPADELWAWAHVHVNDLLSTGPDELVVTDTGAAAARLQAILAGNRDAAYSRLMSPRRLADNTGYHAFVVPTFETGRLAGLGLDPAGAPFATASAWSDYSGRPEPANLPVYYRWFFRTGSHGDFEYLVGLLKPQPVDPRVGVRDVDVLDPGSNLTGITRPELRGILRLGGALQVPRADLGPVELAERDQYEAWDAPYPQPFQRSLAAFVNLPDDYAGMSAAAANAASGLGPAVDTNPDPLITAPLYGRWHALTRRLLVERDGTAVPNPTNWVHRLNLDPRFRVPAAFGAQVVEGNAESYMDDAWQQIGDVLTANSMIRRLHLATAVSRVWHTAHLRPLASLQAEKALALTAPVSRRVLVSDPAGRSTVAHLRSTSTVPAALTSPAMRRVTRPGGRLMRSLPFDATVRPTNLLSRVEVGEVSPARPVTVPAGVSTVDQVAAVVPAPAVPAWARGLLTRFPRLPGLSLLAAVGLLVLAVLLFLVFPPLGAVLLMLAAGAVATWLRLRSWQALLRTAGPLREADQTPAAVDALPASPSFVLSTPAAPVLARPGGRDSVTAVRFKAALRDSYALIGASRAVGQRPAPVRLDLSALTASMVAAVDPVVTIPKRGLTQLKVPRWIRDQIGPDLTEVMAYPKIDLPMYQPLKEMSVEYFLPNINLIPRNSVTLIETNQRFIEAYMVGLNHEFARKLLWREYPTDQRGSYFRQFWDVGSVIDNEGLSGNPLKEKLYDIPELHRWRRTSALGEHNHRAADGVSVEQAVLVVRGELLRKYPNTMVYAQRAVWPRRDGAIDLTVPRELVTLSPAEQLTPPHGKLRSPLYEAKAEPDIYFFGFDLAVPEAQGGDGEQVDDDPGWFFVLKERPGEPRFGLEYERDGALDVLEELSWVDALPGGEPGANLAAGALASVPLVPPSPPQADRQRQHDDDAQVNPAQVSSARWAYLLFRSPVLMAVHASELLAHPGS